MTRTLKKSLFLPLLCLVLGVVPSVAAKKKEKNQKPDEASKTKSLAQVVGEAEKISGLVTFYRSHDKLYLALAPELLDTEMGFIAARVKASGDFLVRDSDLDTQLVKWRKLGGHLILEKQNLNYRAAPDSSLRFAVDKSFSHSPVFMADLIPVSEDVLLIDASNFFGPDLVPIMPRQSGYDAGPSDASLLRIKAFADNVVARVAYRVKQSGQPQEGGGTFARFAKPQRLSDSRFAEVVVDYHFYRLPEDDYRPRVADERIGTFTSQYKDYTDIGSRDTAFRHIVTRWDLRKKHPEQAVSEPVEPITFYVDKAVPDKWRELIHQAGNWWNASFEKIGFRNAFRTLDQPDDPDWDPSDLHHSMIYWNLTDDLIFSGLAGPMYSDPRTGKVLKGNVYLNGEFPSFSLHRYLVYSWWRAPEPGTTYQRQRQMERRRELLSHSGFCDRQASFSSQIAFARLVLQSRGEVKPGDPEADRFAKEAFLELVAHEIGHALGFPHNWKASLVSSWEDVASGKLTGKVDSGIFSSSVMDYNPIYLVPKGKPQGDFFMLEVGPFDDLFVEYIYKPFHGLSPEEEAKALDAIAAKAETQNGLVYDSGELGDIDPTANADDFGDDPLAFAESRLALMQEEVLPRLSELVIAEGHDYNFLRQALDSAIFSVAMDYIDMTGRQVGGQILLRRVADSPAGRKQPGPPPITPVPAADQRRALAILDKFVFRPDAFRLPPETMALLKADLLFDWNYDWRYASDYNLGSRIQGLYNAALGVVLAPERLARVLDNERRVTEGDALTLPELFGHLANTAFGDSSKQKELPAERRALQRELVSYYLKLAVDPPEGAPAEASQVAAYELRKLADRLKPGDFQGYAAAHYADLKSRIQRNLDARVTLPGGK